jgi:flagellar protein FliO/FliZ
MQRPLLACFALLAAPLAWGAEPHPGPGITQLVELLFGLLVVIAAVLLTARVLARLQRGQGIGNAEFRIVSSLAVGQRERIILLQIGKSQLLVGVTPAQIATLHVLAEPIVGLGSPGSPMSAGWLQKVLAKKT